MSRKSNLISLLAMIMVAMLSINFISCGQDDDDVTKKPDDGKEQTDVVSNQDPEGTIVINMNNGSRNNWVDIGIDSYIHIDDANNFVGNNSSVEFASIGLVSGLGKVTTIPSTGWAKSTAVVPGTGYIARYENRYARLYVVDYIVNTSSGIMGATVKYQSPFQLPIILESTSLTFTSNASSQSIKMKDPTSVMIESKPIWCTVSIGSNSITVSVTENLSAQQYTGEIVLGNLCGSAKISVEQKGSLSPKFAGGRGTADDPYKIEKASQWDNMSYGGLNSHYEMVANVDLNGITWRPEEFQGTLNGNDYIVDNVEAKGLFKKLRNASISNLTIKIGINGITNNGDTGALCDEAFNSAITNISVWGDITGTSNTGGICGYAEGTTISKSRYIGNLTGSSCVGGIAGAMYSLSTVSECYTEGFFSFAGYNGWPMGGIVGSPGVGAISIHDCYSTATLGGHANYGICVYGYSNCYFAGKITGAYFGFSGENSYYDTDVLGAGNELDTGGGARDGGRTTVQMMTQANYLGWDFSTVWKITEDQTYPTLRCFDK